MGDIDTKRCLYAGQTIIAFYVFFKELLGNSEKLVEKLVELGHITHDIHDSLVHSVQR